MGEVNHDRPVDPRSHDGISTVPGTPHARFEQTRTKLSEEPDVEVGVVELAQASGPAVRALSAREVIENASKLVGKVLAIVPEDALARKALPVATGVLDYFPDALVSVAEVSRVGNDQHNPGQPLHWDKTKSTGHADSLVRHLLERGGFDVDGVRHSAKVAWRALALLQTELEDDSSEKAEAARA